MEVDLPEVGANPNTSGTLGDRVSRVEDTIDPNSPQPSTRYLPGEDNLDVPGPSSTYFPRQDSPPLPDLRDVHFPPNEHIPLTEDGEDDEEDDEVIATLPIYLSPAHHPNLNLYQYPLHMGSLHTPEWASQRGKSITARVKEQTGRVEIEIPVDEQARFWRDDRATELGFVPDIHANGDLEGGYGLDGKGEVKKKPSVGKKKGVQTEKWGEKRRLRGEIIPNAPGYYSGIVHEGALHLHPISRLVQFRPSMTYIDDFDARQNPSKINRDEASHKPSTASKGAAANIRGGPNMPKEEEENDGSGSIRDFRNKMWAEARKEEADHWVPYAWHSGDDPSVTEKIDNLLVPLEKQERLECSTTGLDYLNRQ